MENIGGGFGSWATAVSRFAPPYTNSNSSTSSCSPFPDWLAVVPPATARTTGSGPHRHHTQHQQQQQLTCLNLGKRQYCDEVGANSGSNKRERSAAAAAVSSSPCSANISGVVARCQVEGCDKALTESKEYHRRHKVCEAHSKAPRVVVQGAHQRFCQQCSRFHAISEFDDAKRSCRRRLAGHNERRRKGSNSDGLINLRNSTAAETLEASILGSYLSPTLPGRALSLLSSKDSPWISTSELSSRSSAALRELIAEHRAALLARQLFHGRTGWHNVSYGSQSMISFARPQNQDSSQGTGRLLSDWAQFQEPGSHLTLDLMQSPTSMSFDFLSGKNKSKEEEEECCDLWKSLEGTHVV